MAFCYKRELSFSGHLFYKFYLFIYFWRKSWIVFQNWIGGNPSWPPSLLIMTLYIVLYFPSGAHSTWLLHSFNMFPSFSEQFFSLCNTELSHSHLYMLLSSVLKLTISARSLALGASCDPLLRVGHFLIHFQHTELEIQNIKYPLYLIYVLFNWSLSAQNSSRIARPTTMESTPVNCALVLFFLFAWWRWYAYSKLYIF